MPQPVNYSPAWWTQKYLQGIRGTMWSMESRIRHTTQTGRIYERPWTDHVGSSPTHSVRTPPASLAPVSTRWRVILWQNWSYEPLGVEDRAASKWPHPKQWNPNSFHLPVFRTSSVRSTQEKRILLWGNWKTPDKGLLKMMMKSSIQRIGS